MVPEVVLTAFDVEAAPHCAVTTTVTGCVVSPAAASWATPPCRAGTALANVSVMSLTASLTPGNTVQPETWTTPG